MTVFVKIPRLSREGLIRLAEDLNAKGFDERAEYYSGGWVDASVCSVAPHLKFEHEADAIAYVLAYGGEICKEIPAVIGWENN